MYVYIGAFQVVLVVKNLPANAGDIRGVGSFPGLGRLLGGGQPTPAFLLENPMDSGAWQAMVLGVGESQTQLKRLSMHARTQCAITDIFNLILEFGFLYKSLLFVTLFSFSSATHLLHLILVALFLFFSLI